MKRKKFYFQDGLGGVVVAKSLNQALNILCKEGYYTKKEIKKGLKMSEEDSFSEAYWWYDCYFTKNKTGFYGYCE